MAEHNPVVQEWISKAEGDWDWTEIDVDSVTARMRDGYVYHLQQCTESGVMNRYPGFDTSTEELLELKGMASRLRQALLLRLGLHSEEGRP